MADNGIDFGDDNHEQQQRLARSQTPANNTTTSMPTGNIHEEKHQDSNLPDISAVKMQKVKALEHISKNPREWAQYGHFIVETK